MEQEQMQQDMTPEEAKAALGLATRLGDQFLMSQAQPMPMEGAETPQSGELELEAEQSPEVDTEGLKNEIMKEVKSAIKEEIGGLKDMLKDALKEDESEEE